MEIITFTLATVAIVAICAFIGQVATELRGIRSVLIEHAQLEPVPVQEDTPSRYRRKGVEL